MQDGTFVKEIVGSAAKPQLEAYAEGAAEGVLALPPNWSTREVRTPAPHAPKVLTLYTLSGLANYLRHNTDSLSLDRMMVHVASPFEVHVIDRLEDETTQFRRKVYVTAEHHSPIDYKRFFDTYHDHESFVVALQTHFEASTAQKELLTLLSGIKDSTVKQNFDDGVAQSINVSAGVALVGEKRIENPVRLRPMRTFSEIEQVESPFIVRLRQTESKPSVALFEADGGAWRLGAVVKIAAWLEADFSQYGIKAKVIR